MRRYGETITRDPSIDRRKMVGLLEQGEKAHLPYLEIWSRFLPEEGSGVGVGKDSAKRGPLSFCTITDGIPSIVGDDNLVGSFGLSWERTNTGAEMKEMNQAHLDLLKQGVTMWNS